MAYQPKSYRKFVATAATATLVASAVAPLASAAVTNAEDFKDVKGTNYVDAVQFLLDKGATSGKNSTEFGTHETIKRVDAAVWLAKVLKLDLDGAPESGFTDVRPDAVKAVNAIKAAGISKGKSPSLFGANDVMTRGQLAVWIVNGFGLTGKSDKEFADAKGTQYGEAVSTLVANEITKGVSATEYGTNNPTKRGDFAKFLQRADAVKNPVVAVETVKAENGKVTVTFAKEVDAVKAEDFKLTQKIDDKEATAVKATEAKLSEDKKSVVLTVPTVEAGEKEQSVVVTAAYKTGKVVVADAFKVASKDAKVVSVSAINATEIEVKFNNAIDKASVFTSAGTLQSSAILTLTGLDSQGSVTVTGAKLSEDGKTLTLTTSTAVFKRYDVVVDGLKAANGTDVAKFQEVVTFKADTTAPTILSTTKNSSSSFTVKFSEPINSLGTVTYALADGTVVAGSAQGVTNNFTTGAKEVTFTLGTDVLVGKEVIATFVGAQDKAGNLLTPNPAKVSFVKGNPDGVAPTISAITQTGAKTFTVKFSEELLANPTVAVSGTTVATVVKDPADSTLYKVTTNDVLNEAATVTVSSFADLSGENGANTSRVVTFVKDASAPKVTSSAVVLDAVSNKQYLEFVFDKEVVLDAAPTVTGAGSYVKNYVTNPITTTATPVSLKADTKNVVRVELDALLGAAATDVEGAVYNLDLSFANVKSAAGIGVESTKASFTRGKDGVPANTTVAKVVAGSVAQSASDNNKVNVKFDTAVDGASATNAANYRIDGAVVESVTLNPVDTVDGTQSVTLNLKAGSNNFTGVRNINISEVKALGSSKVMEPFFTNQVSLKENIAPVVTSAKLTAVDTIKLTFSEAITSGAADDFELLVGGKSQATPEVKNVSVDASGISTITITAVDAAKLASGLSLKALSTLDIVDGAGNKLSVPANITVAQ